MSKKLVGQFLSFTFAGRKDQICGVLLDYNLTWTFLRRCFDYRLDGYTIFKNETFTDHYSDYEKRASRILKLKKYNRIEEKKIPIDNLEKILKYLDQEYQIIQLDDRKGDACDIVKLREFNQSIVVFDNLTPNAKWKGQLRLRHDSIKFIDFDNDYINSLKLIARKL